MVPPRRPRAEPSEAAADRSAWRHFAAAVRPLRHGARHPAPLTPAPVAPPIRASRHKTSLPQPLVIGEPPAGLDRASWRRLSTGRTRPALRLDLHGLPAARAARALEGFLARAAEEGHRTVEVITGQGVGADGGVIRRELPHWLNGSAVRPLLLGACHSHPANPGAVLILLRRRR